MNADVVDSQLRDQEETKSRRPRFLDPKKFAVDQSLLGRGLYLIKMINGECFPHQISDSEYNRELSEDKSYVRMSIKLTDAWKLTGFYKELVSIEDYQQYLDRRRDQKQLSINEKIFEAADCNFQFHVDSKMAIVLGDFQYCSKCQYSRCGKCGLMEGRGKSLEQVAHHWGISLDEFLDLIDIPMPGRYSGKIPVCISSNLSGGVVS